MTFAVHLDVHHLSKGTERMKQQIVDLQIDHLDPAPWNPRTAADPAGLTDLTESIRTHGVLQALLVRATTGDRYQIIAGHRRTAAAQAADLQTVPCVVLEVDDDDAQTKAIVEQLQRESLAPLDEARAFRVMLGFKGDGAGQTAASIGKDIGKSERYVWERVRLLELVPDAQPLLASSRITLQHAIILSRLTAAEQKHAIDPVHGGLFTGDRAFKYEDRDRGKTPDKWDGMKVVSVREFDAWVRDHVHFNPVQAAAAAPLDFGPVAEQVQTAAAQPGRGKKVIQITHDNYVQPDAKDPEGQRTFCANSWKRADGQEKSKPCDHAVLGVIVVGPDYGQAFEVCTKKGCPIHWPEDKQAKAKTDAGPVQHSGNNQQNYAQQQAQRKRHEDAWKAVYPQFLDAVVKATVSVKTTDKHLVDALNLDRDTALAKVIKNAVGSITYKTFGRASTLCQALGNIHPSYYNEYAIPRALKTTKAKFDLAGAMKAALKALETPADTKTDADGEPAQKAKSPKVKVAPAGKRVAKKKGKAR